jgi:hypothetical protein
LTELHFNGFYFKPLGAAGLDLGKRRVGPHMDKKLGGDPSILLFLFLSILTYTFSRCPDQILFALENRVSIVFPLSPS